MIELLRYLVIVPFAANCIAQRSGLIDQLKIWLYGRTEHRSHRLKPLDCGLCLAFWLSVIQLTVTNDWSSATMLYPFAAGCIAALLEKL